jgi:aspartyl-tRNA(Asn)/glutamyl-tRNA(Gln) amidotransferase subunit A
LKEYHQLDEIQKDLAREQISCYQLVQHYLSKIKDSAHLNVFIEVYEQEALQRAQIIDHKIKENKAGKLAGLVFGIKDLLCYAEHEVNGASQILKGYQSPITSTAVQYLLDQDAIVIGRQNCDEFGMGSSNENSAYGPTKNSLDEDKVPGGSSGASAVAVKAGLCLASLGTDTGGSVRQPAAFCGVVGIKPTYSRVSRWGLLAYASSFDTIGVLCHHLEDAELILSIISGKDPKDATSSSRNYPNSAAINPRNFKVAYLKQALESEGVDPVIKEVFQKTIEKLKCEGHTVEGVVMGLEAYLLPTYYILTMAEASTNLSRYDGVHYGQRSKEADQIDAVYKASRTEGFGPEVRRRIMLGTYVLSAEYHDAYFKKAQQIRRLIKDETQNILSNFDVLISPTSPTGAFPISNKEKSPIEMYLSDIFTVQASVAGIPAISIPHGTNENGLPAGLQIMGDSFREDKIFAFSRYVKTI